MSPNILLEQAAAVGEQLGIERDKRCIEVLGGERLGMPPPLTPEQLKAHALMQHQRAMKKRIGISRQHARGNPIRTRPPKE